MHDTKNHFEGTLLLYNSGETRAEDKPQCECEPQYFGIGCEKQCINGKVENDTCVCDPCYTGLSCNKECTNNGKCINGTCDCQDSGWVGEFCDKPGCPGEVPGKTDVYCSEHGNCQLTLRECACFDGWNGTRCDQPICQPVGGPNCNGRGECKVVDFSVAVTAQRPKCTNCIKGFMGDACEIPCNGTQTPMDSGICVCDDNCTHGDYCEHVCSGLGECLNGNCECGNATTGINPGLWGQYCERPGCPGLNGKECSSRGSCVLGNCRCNNRWLGKYCHEMDCPGAPDCSGNGLCVAINDVPTCQCNESFMGTSCELECHHGSAVLDTSVTPNVFKCVCDDCYNGPKCDKLCGGHGNCSYENVTLANTNTTELQGSCVCETAWWGPDCTWQGCPGNRDYIQSF